MKKIELCKGELDYEAIAEEILTRKKALNEYCEDNYIAANFKGCELKASHTATIKIKRAIGADGDTNFVANLEKALGRRSGTPYEITDINVEDDGDMYVGLK